MIAEFELPYENADVETILYCHERYGDTFECCADKITSLAIVNLEG